jgi:hypothetical protein
VGKGATETFFSFYCGPLLRRGRFALCDGVQFNSLNEIPFVLGSVVRQLVNAAEIWLHLRFSRLGDVGCWTAGARTLRSRACAFGAMGCSRVTRYCEGGGTAGLSTIGTVGA